ENRKTGVYGYGFFNDTEDALKAKELVQHGDISSMSIGARKIKRAGSDVIHGLIYEVSLVLAAANPGAMIDTVLQHSDDGESKEKTIIYTGTLIHSADDIIIHEDKGGEPVAETNEERTIADVIDTMNDEQKDAVYALIGMMAEADEEDLELEEEQEQVQHNDEDKGEEIMKQNVFANSQEGTNQDILKHSSDEVVNHALPT